MAYTEVQVHNSFESRLIRNNGMMKTRYFTGTKKHTICRTNSFRVWKTYLLRVVLYPFKLPCLWIISLMSSASCNSHAVSQVTVLKQYWQHVFLLTRPAMNKLIKGVPLCRFKGTQSPSLPLVSLWSVC